MKILLVGNYPHDEQQSMQRFAKLILDSLIAKGHDARLIRPEPLVGRIKRGASGLGKWLGYIDKFVLFRVRLRYSMRWADIVHICDHSNAVYTSTLQHRPHLVTCHDLLAIRSASGEIAANRTSFTGRLFQRWILHGLRRAQFVACVSEQTRSELLRVADMPAHKTRVVWNALNYPYSPMPAEQSGPILDSLGVDISKPYFLHIGGNQWYKNRAGVIRIFAKLTGQPQFARHRLIMAGKPWPEALQRQADSSGVAERITRLVDVSNESLRALYSQAAALLFPSLEEGFGWPIVEAQACGCLVVTSNRAPMTEIGGDAAIYIAPEDEVAAADMIGRQFENSGALARRGLAQSGRFDQDVMLNEYLKVYESLVRSP